MSRRQNIRSHFNPRSSCEERPAIDIQREAMQAISIHAPHARSDLRENVCRRKAEPISIHAPHARSDLTAATGKLDEHEFQSTLLMRGATIARCLNLLDIILFQSTLLMRGATRSAFCDTSWHSYFNPRSSCEERRLKLLQTVYGTIFQSTLLMRGATRRSCNTA